LKKRRSFTTLIIILIACVLIVSPAWTQYRSTPEAALLCADSKAYQILATIQKDDEVAILYLTRHSPEPYHWLGTDILSIRQSLGKNFGRLQDLNLVQLKMGILKECNLKVSSTSAR